MAENRLAVALGFFDGVHAAHGELLRETVRQAEAYDAVPAAVIFDRSPKNAVGGGETELINTVEDRIGIIAREYSILKSVSLEFTPEFMRTRWDDFIKWLAEKYSVACVVAGYDFRFGYRGEGDADKLRGICDELGVGCMIIDRVEVDGETVSSTLIRSLIKDGDMSRANRLLGHRHLLTAEIVTGKRIGRTMGFPTANMLIPEGIIVPKRGVYATKFFTHDGGEYTAVTNVGARPTVNGGDDITVESHLLGFSGDLYGTTTRVEFCEFVREERKFSGVEELRAQIEKDIVTIKKLKL